MTFGTIDDVTGGGRDVAAFFASRIKSQETDEGGLPCGEYIPMAQPAQGLRSGQGGIVYPPSLSGYKREYRTLRKPGMSYRGDMTARG